MALTKVTPSMVNPKAAPIPNTTVGANGEFKLITSSSGGALLLPTIGTWAWFAIRTVDSTGQVALINAGVSAGDTAIVAADGGTTSKAMIWRVS